MFHPPKVLGGPLVAATLALCVLQPADARELITNGGFETGDLTGWTLMSRPLGAPYDPDVAADGRFVIDDADGQAPLSGLSALGPRSGSSYALSDMTAQGTHALLQGFTVPLGAAAVGLSFDMYVHDWFGGGGAVDPSGLDHTTGGIDRPNQHARVDLLTADAGPFDTGTGSVLANFYLGVDPEAQAGLAPAYRPYAFDLTALALPGKSYQLRFGVVDNLFVLNQAVDNVSVTAMPIPEPATWVLLLSGFVPLALIGLRRRARP